MSHGRVDLDGLRLWREVRNRPQAYDLDMKISKGRHEVDRARNDWASPWSHIPGDEWLVANTVEIPGTLRL